MFLSLGHTMSIIWVNLRSLYQIITSGVHAVVSFFNQYLKFQHSLTFSFFITISGPHFSWHQHWPFCSNPLSTAHVVINTFETLLCLQVLIASKHLTPRWQIHFSHNQHFSESMWTPLFFFHALVSIVCLCILITALASLGSMLHLCQFTMHTFLFILQNLAGSLFLVL